MDASNKEAPHEWGKARQVATQGNSGKQKAPPGNRQGFMYVGWLLRVACAA